MGIFDFLKNIFKSELPKKPKDPFVKNEDLKKEKSKIKLPKKSIQEVSTFIKKHTAQDLIKIACKEADMLPYYQDMLNLAQPSTLLLTEKDDFVEQRIGVSKFGGCPDLPKNFKWPKVGEIPLSFLLQINCKDLTEIAYETFPKTGVLSFFFCFDDKLKSTYPSKNEYGKIYHFEIEDLAKSKSPKHPNIYEIQPCKIEIVDFPSFPYYCDYYTQKLWHLDFLNIEADLSDGYLEVCDQLEIITGLNKIGYHQLLGYPHSVQGSNIEFVISQEKQGTNKKFKELSDTELQKVYLQKLILQVQEIDHVDFQLIDCGKIYFMGEKSQKLNSEEIWSMMDFG